VFALFEFLLFMGLQFAAMCVLNTHAENFAGIENEKLHLNEAT